MSMPQVPKASARRVITVLFADLVGFTSLSEQLDPEDVATIQHAYFARSREAVESVGGCVEKFIGDAVVATFGVSQATEQDAVHAIESALSIVRAVDEVGKSLRLPPGSLQVRVGINTGEVHAAPNDDGDWQLTGNVMNVAARLQSAAEPGSVLLGAATALAAELTFLVRYQGDLDLKGKSAPEPAWSVIGPRSEPTRASALHGLSSPILGRDHELTELLASIERSDVGVPAGWLIVAPAGTGKTRLVEELDRRALDRGHLVLRAAVAGHPADARAIIRQLLVAALAHIGVDVARSGRQALREALLMRMAGQGRTGTRAELAADHVVALLYDEQTEGDLPDLHRSWIAMLDSCICHSPTDGDERVVWIVEDLHLAPPDLIAFFDAALMETPQHRALVLTARPGVLNMIREVGFVDARVHQLAPLDSDLVSELIESLVGPGVIPSDIVGGIAGASSGNPLFVEELLRTWVLGDLLRRDAHGSWTFTGGGQAPELPSTVHGVYQSQLDELEGGAREVARTGSVPGHSFPALALPAMGVGEPEPGIEFLSRLGFVVGQRRGPAALDVYTYRHGLLRDVAYASLSRTERAQLHLRFATWLAETSDQAVADELVGTHLAAAHRSLPALAEVAEGQWSRDQLATEAAASLERAAMHQVAQQPARAAELLQQALEIDVDSEPAVNARRNVRRGDALRRAGRLDAAMSSFLRAVEAVDGTESTEAWVQDVRSAAALGYEDSLFASRLPRDEWGEAGLDLIDGALATAKDADRARLLAARGRALTYAGRVDEGRAAGEDALSAANAADNQAAMASALLALRSTQTGPTDLSARIQGTEKIVQSSRLGGDRETELEGWRFQFVDLLEAGEMDRASAAREEAEGLIGDLRQPVSLWYPAMWSAMDAVRRGHPGASAQVEAFREEGERWGYRDVRMVHCVQALQLAIDAGNAEEVLPLARSLHQELPDRFAPVVAAGAAASGNADEAAAMLDIHARDRFAGLPQDLSWLYSLAMYATAAQLIGDEKVSLTIADLLSPWADHFLVLGSGALCLGSISGYVASALMGAGEPGRAESFARNAVVQNERTGCVPAAHWARTLLETVGGKEPSR